MFTNLDRYVHVLTELKISANQFLLCYLLYTDQTDIEGKYVKKGSGMANVYKYSTRAIPWSPEEVEDLVEKGYLEDTNTAKDKTHPDYLEVTDKFRKFVFIEESHFDELNRLFPNRIDNFNNPNGPRIKLKVCDLAKMKELYLKKVKSKVKHRKIMEVLEWAIENDEINFNFENFIRGELWNTLFEARDEGKERLDNNMTVAK